VDVMCFGDGCCKVKNIRCSSDCLSLPAAVFLYGLMMIIVMVLTVWL